MSVLGCNLAAEFCGRGPLEAAGRGIPLGPEDIAFRVNFTTVSNGILTDFSGGHIGQKEAEILIRVLNDELQTNQIKFYAGVSYRNLLVLSGGFSTEVKAEKPDDNQGNPVAEHLPHASSKAGEETALLLNTLMCKASDILANHPINIEAVSEGRAPANGIWPWSGGSAGSIRSLKEKYGIANSAVISAVDVINGLGRCLGMDVIHVPGATGYIDTNYEGKADAAIDALQTHDFVYVHVEAADEVSHASDLKLKLQAIEDFDSRLVGRVLDAIGPEVTVAVLPDHPVPVTLGKHTRTPVPFAIRQPGEQPDSVLTYDEIACLNGSIGAIANGDFMALLFGQPAPPAKA